MLSISEIENPRTGIPPKASHVSRLFSIFLANDSLISVCRGTASIAPVFGLIHGACEAH